MPSKTEPSSWASTQKANCRLHSVNHPCAPKKPAVDVVDGRLYRFLASLSTSLPFIIIIRIRPQVKPSRVINKACHLIPLRRQSFAVGCCPASCTCSPQARMGMSCKRYAGHFPTSQLGPQTRYRQAPSLPNSFWAAHLDEVIAEAGLQTSRVTSHQPSCCLWDGIGSRGGGGGSIFL